MWQEGRRVRKGKLKLQARIPFPNTWDKRETTVPSLVGIQLSSPARAKVGVSVSQRLAVGGMKDFPLRVSQEDSGSEHARIEAAHRSRIDDSNGLSSWGGNSRAFTKIHGGRKLRSLHSGLRFHLYSLRLSSLGPLFLPTNFHSLVSVLFIRIGPVFPSFRDRQSAALLFLSLSLKRRISSSPFNWAKESSFDPSCFVSKWNTIEIKRGFWVVIVAHRGFCIRKIGKILISFFLHSLFLEFAIKFWIIIVEIESVVSFFKCLSFRELKRLEKT